MNESFVFYRSFYEATEDLTDEQLGKVMRAIAEYGLNENCIDMDAITKLAFTLIKPQLDANLRRRKNGAKGGRPVTEKEPNHNLDETKVEANVNANVNANANKEKDSKESKKKSTAFHAPSVEEVREYCESRGNSVDPQKFVDFYSGTNWFRGKTKIKDWKACVRTWEQRMDTGQKPKFDINSWRPSEDG